jgi:hypothetical protein
MTRPTTGPIGAVGRIIDPPLLDQKFSVRLSTASAASLVASDSDG